MTQPPPTPSATDAAFDRAKARFFDGLRCQQNGQLDEAVQHYVASLSDAPGRPSTLTNLAAARLQLGQPEQAMADAQAALQADANNHDAMRHHATALAELGRTGKATAAFQALLALDPQQHLAWTALGNLLMEQGKSQEAADAFQAALNAGGDDALNRFYRAAATAAGAVTGTKEAPAITRATSPSASSTPSSSRVQQPPSPPRAYVETLFDRYAATFDHHLVDQLGYQAHQRVVNSLPTAADGQPRRFRSALDLGCGTGLCGPLLRPRCDHLVGVDLSAAMLERARALNVYDQLHHAEVAEWLSHITEQVDLIVAADVFIYVGALDAVFAAAARLLAPGGIFAFSVESVSEREAPLGFALQTSMRYAHSTRYIENLSAAHGLEVVAMQTGLVRRDGRRDTRGDRSGDAEGAIEGVYVVLSRQH